MVVVVAVAVVVVVAMVVAVALAVVVDLCIHKLEAQCSLVSEREQDQLSSFSY